MGIACHSPCLPKQYCNFLCQLLTAGTKLTVTAPETIANLPKAMADCYYHFQKLLHCKISTLSLMESVNRLRGSRPEIRLTEDQLKRVKQPTMFLWGTSDPFGSIDTDVKISKVLSYSEFHAIQGGSHLPWLDKPAECGRLILDFLSCQESVVIDSEIFKNGSKRSDIKCK